MDKAVSAGHSNRCRIVVDTCCDFSPEVAANLDVDILGFPFIIDGEERTDDIWSSMSPKEFYDRMRAGARVSTSAVSLGRYIEFFTECAKEGTPTVYLCFTSALSQRIELVVERLELDIEPRGVRRVFAIDATGVDEQGKPCIRLVGTNVELRGRDIYRHLKDARFAALMACTLGMDAERRLRTTGAQHPLEGAVLDAACSAYVEAAVEQMDQQVKTDAAVHGLAGNWRFSPGYGDCPLSAQRSIVNALNATRLIGLTVTPTSLLMPTKSVTAVIGLFDGEVHDAQSRPTCNICLMRENCRFRAAHTTCYSSH